jgi:hypothetical protein
VVQQVLLVLKAYKVLQDPQDQVVVQDPQDLQVLKVLQAVQALQDQVAQQDLQVLQVLKVLQEHLLQQSIMEVKVLLPALVPVLLLIHHGKILVVYLFLTFIFQLLFQK